MKRSILPVLFTIIGTIACGADEFTLASGKFAIFQTSAGGFVVELDTQNAPQTVSNFSDLATGKKSWIHPVTMIQKDTPLFDNTRFYYVNKGVDVRGGDPVNKGIGGPGYSLPIETAAFRSLDKQGLLCAESSADSCNGSRFSITLAPQKDTKGVIFGEVVVGFDHVLDIANKPVTKEYRPLDPVTLQNVSIVDVPSGYSANGSFISENDVKYVEINKNFVKAQNKTTKKTLDTVTTNAEKKVYMIGGKRQDSAKADSASNKAEPTPTEKETKKKRVQKSRMTPQPAVTEGPKKKNKLLFWK